MGLLTLVNTETLFDSDHLHNDYLFSGMHQKTAHQRSNAEHRKLISMWFRLRQRASRMGRQSKWESGHGKQHVTVNSINLFAFPHHLHSLSLCICASVTEWRVCMCVCLSTHISWIMWLDMSSHAHSVKSPAIYSRTVLGFPAKHCRDCSSLSQKRV